MAGLVTAQYTLLPCIESHSESKTFDKSVEETFNKGEGELGGGTGWCIGTSHIRNLLKSWTAGENQTKGRKTIWPTQDIGKEAISGQ